MTSFVEEEEIEQWLVEQRRIVSARDGAIPDFNNSFAVAPLSKLEQAMHSVSYYGNRYTRLDDSFKANKAVCIAAIASKPTVYIKMPDLQKADREIAFEAIKRHGSLLANMPEEFQNDRAFLYQAVRTCPSSITYAKEATLLDNIDIVLGAIRGHPTLQLSDKIRENRPVLLYMVGVAAEARVPYGGLSDEMRGDPEVIIAALGHKPFHSATRPTSIVGTHRLNLLFGKMPEEAASNVTTMLKVVRRFPDVYTMLSMEVRMDSDVANAAVCNSGLSVKDKLEIVRTIPLRLIMQNNTEDQVQSVVANIVLYLSSCVGNNLGSEFFDERSFSNVLINRDIAVALAAMSNGFVMKQMECMVHYKQVVGMSSEAATEQELKSSFDLAKGFVEDVRDKSRGYSVLFNTLIWRYLFDLTSVKFFRSVEFAKIGIDFYAHKYCMTSTKHDFLKAIKIDSVSDGTLIGEQNLPVDLMEHIVSTGDSDLIRHLPFGKIKDPRFGLMALNSGRFALCHFVDGYVSADAVKATTLVTAWLESLAVVQIVTEMDRSVIKEIRARLRQYSIRPVFTNFAKVFELIPTAQQNDHNVAIDIVKSWGRRAASYELEALVEAMVKATKDPVTGFNIFRDPELEQQLVIHTNRIIDTNGTVLKVSAVQGRQLTFDFGRAFVSDTIVLSLLSIAYHNRYSYSKSGCLTAHTVWLSSFEYDLVKQTTGDAEKRFKKAKAEKGTPAGYTAILDADEWTNFASGHMSGDAYDALIAKQNKWADALVEIVAKSKRSNKRLSDIATRIFEFLTRSTGAITSRLQRQEFEEMADDIAGEGAETARERRDRMRHEIAAANDSDVEEEEEVGESSTVGEKRGRDAEA